MSTTRSAIGKAANRASKADRWQQQREGIALLFGIVALMWFVEIVNAADGYALSNDGLYPRSVSHLWGIFTAPFIHANFSPHLIDNTIPFLFLGLIIAWRGARRLAAVTAIVIVLGGLLTWLVAPSGDIIGASGVVFGYATYLLTRGFFDRSALELFTGLIVAVIWGGALLASVVPQGGNISWQGHLMGGIAGVVAAWWMANRDSRRKSRPGKSPGQGPAVPVSTP
jgi:membrane associated rhomboid family serine protease